MKQHIFLLACLCSAAFVYVSAVPLPAGDRELDVLQIPLSNGKEIDVLTLGSTDQEQAIAERNKRTIGLLRELFPDITKQIDAVINQIVQQILQQLGPSILGNALNPSLTQGGRTRINTDDENETNNKDDDSDDNDDNNNGENNTPQNEVETVFKPDEN